MRTEYFLFVHHATSILAKLRTWCFEHSGDISSCSLLVNPSHTDESWNTYIYIYYIYIYIYLFIYKYNCLFIDKYKYLLIYKYNLGPETKF